MSKRIPKSLERRIGDCESHLRFLSEALQAYETEPDRYKQVAAELRVLVCSEGRNHPLLLDLMDDLDFTYELRPIRDLPFPLRMVDEPWPEIPPEIQAQGNAAIMAWWRTQQKPIPLRRFVDSGFAVFIEGRTFTNKELILAVAQQLGSSHEDPTVDRHLAELETYIIGGFSGYGATLRSLGPAVLDAGVKTVLHAAKTNGYTPQFFGASGPDAA